MVRLESTLYGEQALATLRRVVGDAKREDPMAPVSVLVPGNLAGIVARRALAAGTSSGRPGVAGLEVTTIPRLAERLAATRMTPRRPTTGPVLAAAWRSALRTAPGVFAPVAEHPATVRALARAHHELRDISGPALGALEALGGVTGDLVRLHRLVRERLAPQWYDARDLLDAAGRRPAFPGLGHVVLHLPQQLTQAEARLLAALATRTQLTVVAGLTGTERGDRAVHRSLARLGLTAPPGPRPGTATSVITASDSDDEVRCVVREVVTTLRTTPAHRVAVLYAARSPYARLLHEHLASAGITVNGAGTRAADERALGRTLREVLALADRDVPRADLFRALAGAPVRDFAGARVPITAWERLSRSAGVVAADDWDARLATYERDQHAEIAQAQREEKPGWAAAAEQRIAAAEGLRAFATRLRQELRTAQRAATWADLAGWCREMFEALVELERAGMPAEEQYAATAVLGTLDAVSGLDGLDVPPSLDLLREVLDVELSTATPRVGRFGEGVLVAPLAQGVGLELDAVFVLGLAEDLYPGRAREDSLLPAHVRDTVPEELAPHRERVDASYRHLLAAFASAPRVVASFPRGDLRRSHHRLPSRFLLPSLRALTGRRDLPATRWQDHPAAGIAVAPSHAGELLRTGALATDQEWRVRSARAGGPLDRETTTAVALVRGRAAAAFTRFDGHLRDSPGLLDHASSPEPVSPTALEAYAGCPHAYFVRRMLQVEPVEQPEDLLQMSPLEIGNLVHESLDRLVRDHASSLPGYGAPWAPAQRARLIAVAEELAAGYEARGLTGHPRLWQRERQRILTDLARLLDDDDRWRAEVGARVVASEVGFGARGDAPVAIALPHGRLLMRGSVDRIDEDRTGRLYVTDVKTGSRRDFEKIQDADPFVRGTKLQLPAYAYAARAHRGTPAAPVTAAYWFIRRDRGRVSLELTPGLETAYAATLQVLVDSIAAGLFPELPPAEDDFGWVRCGYCSPDGLGYADGRRRWRAHRGDPALARLVALVDPDAAAGGAR